MADMPKQTLLQQAHARPVSGEELETLGRQAASAWRRGEHKSLSDSVVETVKQAHLSPEQVRRVVEFTNQSAYVEEFRESKEAHRVVDFPGGPADPSAVIMDLNDGGGGTINDDGSLDYSLSPSAVRR